MELRERVKKALNETTLSVRYIARNIDVNEATIYRWKKGGTKSFDPQDIKSLANILQIDYNWLQHGKEKQSMSADNEKGVDREAVKYQSTGVDVDINAEPSLDDLPQLVRLRDKVDEKIRMLIEKNRS